MTMTNMSSQTEIRLGKNTLLPFVSVIVPVYNDAEKLTLCLAALENQTYPRELYEIIVVDNSSTEDISGALDKFIQVLLATESQPGSYAARNKGLSIARGDVIGFTDSDCIPENSWVERGVEHLLAFPDCGLLAGKIRVYFRNDSQPTPVEVFERLTAFPQKELLDKRRFGATANVFTTREVIKRVGCFDSRLKSHGDLEWGQRVYASGYQQIYADDVLVSHPARYSIAQLYHRTVRLVGGEYTLHSSKEMRLLSRNLIFIFHLVKSLSPPLFFVARVFREREIGGVNQKINVSLIMFFVRYLTAWELIRLKFGKNPAR